MTDGANILMSVPKRLERILLVLGLLLLSFYAAARIYGSLSSRAELSRFWRQPQESQSKSEVLAVSAPNSAIPDFRLWSEKRISAYKMSLENAAPPLAVLRIQSIHLEAPVLEGTDDFTLNRAVGHIGSTAAPGEDGNIGIAGHRDGFFRGLKDIRLGDTIDLVAPTLIAHYVVDKIQIVTPDDISVLRPRAQASLTLVTCYPFYFVGSAPKRFIVQASIVNSVGPQGDAENSAAALSEKAEEKH